MPLQKINVFDELIAEISVQSCLMFRHKACLGLELHSFASQRSLTFVEILIELATNEI